jgi:hypothetical protein
MSTVKKISALPCEERADDECNKICDDPKKAGQLTGITIAFASLNAQRKKCDRDPTSTTVTT